MSASETLLLILAGLGADRLLDAVITLAVELLL